jgi:glutathione synthase/RimK-type ligase-like ATP-grasp enzyme
MVGSGTNRQTVLLVAASRWAHTAFVAARLQEVGFSVAALCPQKGALRHTSGISRFYDYSRLRGFRSILAAIRDCSPALLAPGDDEAAAALYELHAHCTASSDADANDVRQLIEKSLGPGDSFSIAQSKLEIVRLARECGIRVPPTREIENLEDILDFARTAELPFLLKQEETSGGRGIVVVRSAETAGDDYQSLKRRSKTDALRDLAFRWDISSLVKTIARSSHPRIAAQSFVAGKPANRAVACWKGEVVAGISVLALETDPPGTGTASVVEVINHREIAHAVRVMVAKLGLSGFCGFDFVLDDFNRAHLLELNARLTSACWIGTTAETDLCGALYEAMTGTPRPIRETVRPKWPSFGVEGQRLTLFPQEWMRSKTSEHLYSPFHRVPWHDPQLLGYLVASVLNAEKRNEKNSVLRMFERLMSRIERAEVQSLANAGRDGNQSA